MIYSQDVFAMPMTQKLWGGLTKSHVHNLEKFSIAIKENNYNKALEIIKESQTEFTKKDSFFNAMHNILLWKKYSKIDDKIINSQNISQNISFNDISRFVNDNRFFPNIFELRQNVEKIAMSKKTTNTFSKKYFVNFPPTNTEAKIYFLESNINQTNSKSLDQQNIQDLIIDLWTKEDLSIEQEQDFLANYGDTLVEENHIARVNNLLWNGQNTEASRIFYLLGDDYKKLFLAIIKLGENNGSFRKIFSSVPRLLRSNDLLAYNVIMWHKRNNKDLDDIVDILENIPAYVSNPKKWWSIRKLYARELLKNKDYKVAYRILSNHGLTQGSIEFADAEWMSGWVALRFLNKSEIAYNHFNNVYLNVSYPISISRAAYWLGEASLAKGDKKKAIDWYKVATKYPIYFYGQLAIHKHRVLDSIGSQNDIILPDNPAILDDDIKAVAKESSVIIAYLLSLIGDKENSTKVFEYAVANAKTDGEIAIIMRVVSEIKDKEMSVKLSKVAAKRNVFFIKDQFQIIKEIENDPNSPLIHAIVKQESGFAPTALSSVGAVGFMQLMPKTAELVCAKLGIGYDRHKLATNMTYNITLGSSYIKLLIDQFDGSELLAIAAYNAGPNNSKRWINEFYDPRDEKDINRVVDWIELITYSETRNYVQRIMENLIVYKYLMSRVNYDEIN